METEFVREKKVKIAFSEIKSWQQNYIRVSKDNRFFCRQNTDIYVVFVWSAIKYSLIGYAQ